MPDKPALIYRPRNIHHKMTLRLLCSVMVPPITGALSIAAHLSVCLSVCLSACTVIRVRNGTGRCKTQAKNSPHYMRNWWYSAMFGGKMSKNKVTRSRNYKSACRLGKVSVSVGSTADLYCCTPVSKLCSKLITSSHIMVLSLYM